MTVIVTDDGVGPNNWIENEVIDLGPETDLETLEIDVAIEKIRIEFHSFSDRRGFTLGRLLRLLG